MTCHKTTIQDFVHLCDYAIVAPASKRKLKFSIETQVK